MPTIAYVQELVGGGGEETTIIANSSGAGGATYKSLTDQGVFRTGYRPVFENFRGDIYLGGSYTRPLVRQMTGGGWLLAGIKPPQIAVSVAPGTGSGGSSGDCLAYITFLHKEGNRVLVESNPSNIVDVGALTGEGRDWSNIQAVDAELRVTHVRGYVSMNGGDYRMAWEAPYGVTAVSENVTTSRLSLLGPNEFRNDVPPFGVRYIHPWAGRMWYANNPEFPYRIWYSRPGYPQYVGKAQFRDTLEREPITGMWRGRNELIVFCQDNSYLIRQFGQGQDDFVMERLDSNVGAVSHHTIKEIHNRIWFAARDGIWIYDGAFRYVLDDMRPKFEEEYCKDRQSFENAFSVYDKLNKVYMLFRSPTIADGEEPEEWEPKTGIFPKTVIWVGYIGEFEPSMNGQDLQPDWTFDFRGRADSSSLYGGATKGGSGGNELYIASCDGKIRRQIKPCELEAAPDDYRQEGFLFDRSTYGADDDADTVQKKLIIRHSHMLFGLPGDDIQTGKHVEQVWAHMESSFTEWTFYGLGGDEDSWNQIRPDNVVHFWKRTWPASDLYESRTFGGVTGVATYTAQSVHFMLPEELQGRGFTFEVQALSPLLMKYRGVGGMWSPGPADRMPSNFEACTYVTLALEAVSAVDLVAQAGSITAADIDTGTVGAEWWRLELLDDLGVVVQTSQDPDPASAVLNFDCSNVGANNVRVSAWNRDLDLAPYWEGCAAQQTVVVNVADPGGSCP